MTPRPRLTANPGDLLRVVGDSIHAGSAATIPGVNDCVSLFALERGLGKMNLSVSGKGCQRATKQTFLNNQPSGLRTASVHWSSPGHNDLLSYVVTKTPLKIAGCDRAWYAGIWAKTCVAASDAILTKSGGWSAGPSSYDDKASLALSGTIMESSTSGDTITWTATDTNAFIGCFAGKGSGGTRVGSFDVKRNGTVVLSYDGDGKSDCSGVDGVSLTQDAQFIWDIIPGDTLQIVNTGGAGAVRIDYVGSLRSPMDCEPAARWHPPRPSNYSLGGGTGSVAAFDAGDAAIEAGAEEFSSRGYPVRVVRTNAFLDPARVAGDGEHPDKYGHRQLRRAADEVFHRPDQINLSGWAGPSNVVGLSGGTFTMPTVRGVIDGKIFHFAIRIDPASGVTLTSSRGTTTVPLPPGIYPEFPGPCEMVSCGTAITPYPVGMVNNGNNLIYLPDAVITEPTILLGWCVLD